MAWPFEESIRQRRTFWYFMAEGIAFPYHVQVGNKINFNEKLAKLKNVLNAWSSRHLTILGRIAIVKSLALAKLV